MDQSVIILGGADLPKKVLAYTITKEMGIECSIAGGAEDVFANGHGAKTALVLVDFADPERERMLADLRVRSIVGTRYLVALYNVGSAGDVQNAGMLTGIHGLFYQRDSIELLIKGIRAILDGEIWLPRKVLVQIAMRSGGSLEGDGLKSAALTRREVEILSCIANGHTNGEISRKLSVSSNTVKTHLYRVFKKINVRNRFQASLWAAKHL